MGSIIMFFLLFWIFKNILVIWIIIEQEYINMKEGVIMNEISEIVIIDTTDSIIIND